jgi:hypothetical protein
MVSLFNEIKKYLEAKYNLARLDVTEKSIIVFSLIIQIIIVALLSSLILIALSLTLGYFLGNYWDSNGLGFLAVTGLYILLLLVFIIFRKALIIRPVSRVLIRQLLNRNNEEGEDDEENDI